MEIIKEIRRVRKLAEENILTAKPITVEYNKEGVSEIVQKYLQTWEDFFNDNFEKMYDQMILYGTWIIVRLKDGSLELV